MDGCTYEQFEEARTRAIIELKALHYENDPHFILATGDHTEIITSTCTCINWADMAFEKISEDLRP